MFDLRINLNYKTLTALLKDMFDGKINIPLLSVLLPLKMIKITLL